MRRILAELVEQCAGEPLQQRATFSALFGVRTSHATSNPCTITGARCVRFGSRRSGPYAEGAHIRPLARPHNGPDVPENVLCLCPNCHVLFDQGAITVEDDFTLQGRSGTLRLHPRHSIDVLHLRYHREHYG